MDTRRSRRVREMRIRIYGFAAGGVALVMALAAAAAPPATHGPVTKVGGELFSMSAVSASDVWATGLSADARPLMMHWDGSAWTRITVPDQGSPSLSSVSADSPRDAWAVGATNTARTRDVAMHWNGTRWAEVPVPSPSKSLDLLASVSAASPDDVWAAGTTGNIGAGTRFALVLHWNGKAWSQVPIPHAGRYELLAVTALSASDVWAVGDVSGTGILVLHWNGTAWSQAAIPRLDGDLAAVTALSPTDAWAAGHYHGAHSDKSLVLHWNGTDWTRQASPSPSRAGVASVNTLNGVSAVSASNVWAVGFYGRITAQGGVDKPLILHWNGTRWTRAASPSFSGSSGLFGVAALSHTDAWAAGGTLPNKAIGTTVILHWNGTAWTRS